MLNDFDAWRFSGIQKESPVCLRLKDKRPITVNRNTVLYAEKKFSHLILHTKGESYILQNMPMEELAEILGDDFVQCHRRFVVNIMCSKLADKSWDDVMVLNTDVVIDIRKEPMHGSDFIAKYIAKKKQDLMDYEEVMGILNVLH